MQPWVAEGCCLGRFYESAGQLALWLALRRASGHCASRDGVFSCQHDQGMELCRCRMGTAGRGLHIKFPDRQVIAVVDPSGDIAPLWPCEDLTANRRGQHRFALRPAAGVPKLAFQAP